MNPIFAVLIIFGIIVFTFLVIYAFKISISGLQVMIIVGIVFFALLSILAYYTINKLLKKKGEKKIDLEEESWNHIVNWWKKKTGEDLTYEDSSFKRRFGGEMFAIWKVARRVGGKHIGVIVGTKPQLSVALWDWIIEDEDLETMWGKVSPIVPGYASEYTRPEDTVFALRKASPTKETVKEIHKETGWEDLEKKEGAEEKEK